MNLLCFQPRLIGGWQTRSEQKCTGEAGWRKYRSTLCKRSHVVHHSHSYSRVVKCASNNQPPGDLYNLLNSVMKQLLENQSNRATGSGAAVQVQGLAYHPPGSATQVIDDVSLYLPPNNLGVVFGRSGSGKTTLLALIAGLINQTAGSINIDGLQASTAQQRQQAVGLVFQFPERHFVGTTIAEELSLTWPRSMGAMMELQAVASRVVAAVGLDGVPLDTPLQQLSGGYQRRVALCVALCRRPRVLLLDEPLAGLDWKAREDVTQLLGDLKSECSILVVSHDLKELETLVDVAWCMMPGGALQSAQWPATSTT